MKAVKEKDVKMLSNSLALHNFTYFPYITFFFFFFLHLEPCPYQNQWQKNGKETLEAYLLWQVRII